MGAHRNIVEQDLHEPSNILVFNDTGSIIPKLKIVKADGATSEGILKVTPVTSLTDNAIGVLREEIIDQAEGQMAGISFIRNINTAAFNPVANLFSDVNGNLTSTPSDIIIGFNLVQDATKGIIFVNPLKSVPDAGSITVHSDVSNAGSGKIITVAERAEIIANSSLISGSLISAHVEGCQVIINSGDDSLFDMAEGLIYITALNGPIGSTGIPIVIPERLAQAHSAGGVTRIVLNASGAIVISSFTRHLTEAEKRAGNVQIKLLGHSGGLATSTIESTFTTISARFGANPQSNAAMFAAGIQANTGLELILNANLTTGRGAGSQFDPLAANFFNDPNNEFTSSFNLVSPVTFFHSWMGDNTSSVNLSGTLTDIDPSSWDDPTLTPGVGTPDGTLAGNEAQNISVHEAASDAGSTFVYQYGRIKYANFDAAKAGAQAEMRARTNIVVVKGTAFRGLISVSRAETNLFLNAFFTAPSSRSIETL